MLEDAGTLRLTTPVLVSDDARQDFPGAALAIIVEQPSDVERLAALVGEGGGRTAEPAGKQFFGGFCGSCIAPGGTPWKISAQKEKNSGSPATAAGIR
ncbi:hypothetical protein OK351_07195 [Glutamicibacter sp. MNS18]|uniref:hypothetical protein n=1 Tax=Glutamicibacter sp. MNS18 TaxID=2989817 RepID=UPI00223616F0|nr:hypothetical protein [Glutamicibacter sp. MNS18]MCW4465285.1 hypothetical protein [Glutamicibacter sp. MNS18]